MRFSLNHRRILSSTVGSEPLGKFFAFFHDSQTGSGSVKVASPGSTRRKPSFWGGQFSRESISSLLYNVQPIGQPSRTRGAGRICFVKVAEQVSGEIGQRLLHAGVDSVFENDPIRSLRR